MLIDNHHRRIDYLRISVTDRCNLRCSYCMPKQGIVTNPQKDILTFEEIVRLTRIFSFLGIKNIRLTGGEPLVRRGIVDLIKALGEIEGIEDIALTTNGILLGSCVEDLKRVGLKRINISLDTLRQDRFRQITGSENFSKVLEGISAANKNSLLPLKLNVVVMKGINDDEITDFMDFCLSRGIVLRFIEFMKVTPLWREDYFIPIEDVKKICQKRYKLNKVNSLGWGPAEYYSLDNGLVGFIKTEEYNCRSCTRLRLTSTGELKICLYQPKGISLRDFLRNKLTDSQIKDIIKKNICKKSQIDYRSWEPSNIYMCSVGG